MKKINVLQLPPYSYPEQISSSHLTEDLLLAFSNNGICTIAYAPFPCRGIDDKTREKYKKIKHECLYNNSYNLYRFSLYKEGKNAVLRAVRYILCNIIQYSKGIKTKSIDVIYSSSTPPTQGVLCGLVKSKLEKKYNKKIPYIYNLQDVFPDSLVSAGLTKKGSLVWKIGSWIEKYTYSSADAIIVISEDIKKNLLSKNVDKEKIHVVPNWIDTELVHHVSKEDNPLFDAYGISRDKFNIVYAGNIGSVQGLDILVNVAKKIPDVEFQVFGDGSQKNQFVEATKKINNIHVFPLLSKSQISNVYSLGDLCLVSCKKGLGKGAVPSKTYTIMACNTPILLCFDKDTELWEMIENNKCGSCIEAGDVDRFVDAVTVLKNNKALLNEMGKNGRDCVKRNYSKNIATEKIIKIINEELSK